MADNETPSPRCGPVTQSGETMVPTLNGMGYMIAELDEVSQAFVDFAAKAARPVLDVGAAFGIATLAALETGARVIANDVEARHLDSLWEQSKPQWRDRLTLAPGAFPDEVDLPTSSLSAALLSRVMHFFDGEQIERAAAKLFAALENGGKVFATVDASVFLDEPPLRREYEKRTQAGERWPGYFANVGAIHPDRGPMMPDRVHCLSPKILARAFSEAGFEIERSDEFSRRISGDAAARPRRTVALIARKPTVVG